jgi:plastocyanin
MKKIQVLLCFTILAFGYLNAQTKHIVEASNFMFDPADITIAVGDTVEWVWINGAHTTTSDSTTGQNAWDEPLDVNNTSFSFVITAPGVHNYHCTPHQSFGMVGKITATVPNAVDDERQLPGEYQLGQNYPNPFNPSTKIVFSIPVESNVKIKVYNSLGNEISTIVNKFFKAGRHEINFNAKQLASGVYYYTLSASKFSETKKMVLIR